MSHKRAQGEKEKRRGGRGKGDEINARWGKTEDRRMILSSMAWMEEAILTSEEVWPVSK